MHPSWSSGERNQGERGVPASFLRPSASITVIKSLCRVGIGIQNIYVDTEKR